MSADVAILANPIAGGGRAVSAAATVARRLGEHGLHVRLVTPQDAATHSEIAAQCVDEGVRAVLACGGDGTVHWAIQHLVGTGIPFGIIPAGTGNDSARLLGPRTATLTELASGFARAIDVNATRQVDVASATVAGGLPRYFLAVLSSGFDSTVNERANRMSWPTGQAKYISAMVAELRTFQPLPYRVELDGREITGLGMLVSVGNGTSFGGGMRVCPDAVVDDGLLDLTWLHDIDKATFLRVFPRVYRGTHVTHPAVSTYRAQSIRIEAPGQVAYADGERLGPLPVDITAVPGGLRMLDASLAVVA